MARRAPGKAHREGITLAQLTRLFPNEEAATEWFESVVWKRERCCGHCGCLNTKPVPNAKPMPYRCPDCRKYFSVRTGTVLRRSHISLQNWAFGIYLEVTNLKGVSQHEAPSRPRDLSEVRLVHAPSHTRDVGSQARRIQWPGRSR